MTEFLQNGWLQLGNLSSLEYIILFCCILLVIAAGPLFKHVFRLPIESAQYSRRLQTFRAIAFLIIAAILLNRFIFSDDADASIATKLLGIIIIVFSAFWMTQILHYFIRRQYGQVKEFSGNKVITDSYNSRLLGVLATVMVVIFSLISIIQVLGLDSLLEAGGIIGFIGVMLALTQGAWAPDIISGLVILNSDLLDSGEIIELDDGDVTAQVFRIKLFHTELLDLVNNNRILIKNAKLRDKTIHNLSKFASAKGYRERQTYKIGYDAEIADVKAMFERAYELAAKDDDIAIESDHALEIRIVDTGDYAVEWAVFFYTKQVRYVLKTRYLFKELVLRESLRSGIDLSTPDLYQRVNTTTGVASSRKIDDNRNLNS